MKMTRNLTLMSLVLMLALSACNWHLNWGPVDVGYNSDPITAPIPTQSGLPEPTETQIVIRDDDLEFTACRGSGAGGQHRNVTASAVQLKHKPSGLMVRCEGERSQHQNRETAMALLRARLWELKQNLATQARAEDRRQQVGSGMRGDKRRTIRTQDDRVTDHLTGRTWQFKNYVRGIWES